MIKGVQGKILTEKIHDQYYRQSESISTELVEGFQESALVEDQKEEKYDRSDC